MARAAAAAVRLQERDAKRDEVARTSPPASPRQPTPRHKSPKSYTDRMRRSRRTSAATTIPGEDESDADDYLEMPPPCSLHHPHPAAYSRCGGTKNERKSTSHTQHRTTVSDGATYVGSEDVRRPFGCTASDSPSQGGSPTNHHPSHGHSSPRSPVSKDEMLMIAHMRREAAGYHTCARCSCPGYIDKDGKRGDDAFMRERISPRRVSPRNAKPLRTDSVARKGEEVDSWRRDVHQAEGDGFDRAGGRLPQIDPPRQSSQRHSGDTTHGDSNDNRFSRQRASSHRQQGSSWDSTTHVASQPQHMIRRSVLRLPRKPSLVASHLSGASNQRRRQGRGQRGSHRSGGTSPKNNSSPGDGDGTSEERSDAGDSAAVGPTEEERQQALKDEHALNKHLLEQSEWREEMDLHTARTQQNQEKAEYYRSMIAAVEEKLRSVKVDHAAELLPIQTEHESKSRRLQEQTNLRLDKIRETEDARIAHKQCLLDIENLRIDIENARADRVLNFIPRVPNTDGLVVSSSDIGRTTTGEQDQYLSEFNDVAAFKTAEAALRQRALRREKHREDQLNHLQTLLLAKGGGGGRGLSSPASMDMNTRPIQMYRTCEPSDVQEAAAGEAAALQLLQSTTNFGSLPPPLHANDELGEGSTRVYGSRVTLQEHIPEILLAPYIPLLEQAVRATSSI